jgi:hypothetical protein
MIRRSTLDKVRHTSALNRDAPVANGVIVDQEVPSPMLPVELPPKRNTKSILWRMFGLAPATTVSVTDVDSSVRVPRHWFSAFSIRTVAIIGCLVVIIAAGAFLRLWKINALGLNTDEAVYAGQAAGIIGDPALKPYFPVFRAHPLLFQFIVSLGYLSGVSDLTGRLFGVGVGLITIYLVYHLGSLLYGKKAGLIAALIIALMPYHVVITRQILLDGPMALCATLTLYLTAMIGTTKQPKWLYAVGAALGLTLLAKETGFILIGAVYTFLTLYPAVRVRVKDIVISIVCIVLIVLPFTLSTTLAGGSRSTQSYLIWQIFRRPNHEWYFYATTVPFAIGLLVIVAALLGVWLLRREHSWKETLLLAWILVPTVFFQIWPVKGFQYLIPTAPALAVLAARAIVQLLAGRSIKLGRLRLGGAWLQGLAVAVVAATLAQASWAQIQPSTSDQFLAGSGGVPGGREAGRWVKDNVPKDAKLLALGPSMANIIQFYGHRKTYGLAVSPNPLHRNPSYEPVSNPDLRIRSSELQYLIWDSFSAARSSFFADNLMKYVRKYHGRVIHTESVMVTTPDGKTVATPVIVIYQVRP